MNLYKNINLKYSREAVDERGIINQEVVNNGNGLEQTDRGTQEKDSQRGVYTRGNGEDKSDAKIPGRDGSRRNNWRSLFNEGQIDNRYKNDIVEPKQNSLAAREQSRKLL